MLSHTISRVVRGVCLAALGVILLFFPHGFFVPIYSTLILSHVMPVWLQGIGAIITAGLIQFDATRIAGYILGIGITGALTICVILTLWQTPSPHSPTVVLFPIILLSFVEGLSESVKRKYDYDNPAPILTRENYNEDHEGSGQASR